MGDEHDGRRVVLGEPGELPVPGIKVDLRENVAQAAPEFEVMVHRVGLVPAVHPDRVRLAYPSQPLKPLLKLVGHHGEAGLAQAASLS